MSAVEVKIENGVVTPQAISLKVLAKGQQIRLLVSDLESRSNLFYLAAFDRTTRSQAGVTVAVVPDEERGITFRLGDLEIDAPGEYFLQVEEHTNALGPVVHPRSRTGLDLDLDNAPVASKPPLVVRHTGATVLWYGGSGLLLNDVLTAHGGLTVELVAEVTQPAADPDNPELLLVSPGSVVRDATGVTLSPVGLDLKTYAGEITGMSWHTMCDPADPLDLGWQVAPETGTVAAGAGALAVDDLFFEEDNHPLYLALRRADGGYWRVGPVDLVVRTTIDALLKEDGDYLLQENGSRLLLEA